MVTVAQHQTAPKVLCDATPNPPWLVGTMTTIIRKNVGVMSEKKKKRARTAQTGACRKKPVGLLVVVCISLSFNRGFRVLLSKPKVILIDEKWQLVCKCGRAKFDREGERPSAMCTRKHSLPVELFWKLPSYLGAETGLPVCQEILCASLYLTHARSALLSSGRICVNKPRNNSVGSLTLSLLVFLESDSK